MKWVRRKVFHEPIQSRRKAHSYDTREEVGVRGTCWRIPVSGVKIRRRDGKVSRDNRCVDTPCTDHTEGTSRVLHVGKVSSEPISCRTRRRARTAETRCTIWGWISSRRNGHTSSIGPWSSTCSAWDSSIFPAVAAGLVTDRSVGLKSNRLRLRNGDRRQAKRFGRSSSRNHCDESCAA